MSEDSTQLSVAELLARNGQGVPSSGGGRRRRGGRGIAVTDLTGDIPEVREGSSHAAPDAEPAPEQMPDFQLSAPGYDNQSPVSGPISYYDPLAGEQPSSTPSWQQPNSFQPSAFEPAPDPGYRSAPDFGGFGSTPDAYGAPAESTGHYAPESPGFAPDAPPAPSGRRARRELREALNGHEAAPFAPEQPADTNRPGRRHRPDPDERHTMVVPPFSGAPQADPVAAPWEPAPEPEAGPREFGAPDIPAPGGRGGAPGRNGAEAPRGLPAWSARRRAPAPAPPPRDFNQPGFPGPEYGQQNFAQPDFGGPEYGAPGVDGRAGEQQEDRSAGWSLAGRDAQLLSGETVAGDLLRDANERGGDGRRNRGPRRGVIDLLDPAEAATEFYEPLEPELDDDIDDEYDDELLDDEDEQPSRWKRPAGLRMPSLPAVSSLSLRVAGGDTNRKQWLVLGGQAVGAAVAGMLLFKGFEQIWDTMPFVALILAMVVILGLVALVRVLRRTDDILSTVIAVVVGIFVTLGPLAFLLSTN
ncbi:hypothetical protein AB0L57_26710 [Nocardia sp. NPDC052254]|uniref:hypothetical protein n=1 Tax=Nocardia sp. NPDC052254 TaxID=3155681 RepID=UPI0034248626